LPVILTSSLLLHKRRRTDIPETCIRRHGFFSALI
jgi:hypothetical protein